NRVVAVILPTHAGSQAKSLRTTGSCSTSVFSIARTNPGLLYTARRRSTSSSVTISLWWNRNSTRRRTVSALGSPTAAIVLSRRALWRVRERGHPPRLVGVVAGGVRPEPVHPVGVVRGQPRRDPAAERLAGHVRGRDVQDVHQPT